MDPDETLAELLSLARDCGDGCTDRELELSQLIIDLDDWLKRGGFMPKRWEKVTR